MQYSITGSGSDCVISVSGEMSFSDHNSVRTLIGELDDKSPKTVVADLSSLEGIDSAGVGMLMLMDEAGKEGGYKFSIRGVKGQVEQVLNICRLSEVIDMS